MENKKLKLDIDEVEVSGKSAELAKSSGRGFRGRTAMKKERLQRWGEMISLFYHCNRFVVSL